MLGSQQLYKQVAVMHPEGTKGKIIKYWECNYLISVEFAQK